MVGIQSPNTNQLVGHGVEVVDVQKHYPHGDHTIAALRGATLSVPSCGFHAIMGASGSGKSTLLHLIAGLDRPDSGTITVAGSRIDSLCENDLTMYRRRKLGIVFQHFNLLPTLTALDNVKLPGVLDGKPDGEVHERAMSLLRELGVASRADHRPEALSGGEQQRVAIARALLFDPPLILADEPTGNLDSMSSERLWALLEDIARVRELLVLMVTHEPLAASHCQTTTVLRDGIVAGSFASHGLTPNEFALRASELGR
ncbi:MAG: ABC transporter ATP-binding protein [Planctomycetota bacterium]|nr:ABC transporter ATP-binding protein [Planctomycetota bacterium]